MADNTKTEITDAQIETMTSLVDASEQMAKTMNITVADAFRLMMKAGQAFNRVQQSKGADLADAIAKVPAKATRVQ